MRPLHIVIFVLAGALGGAVLMKLVERPQPRRLIAIAPERTALPQAGAGLPQPAAPLPPSAASPSAPADAPSPIASVETPQPAPPASPAAPAPVRHAAAEPVMPRHPRPAPSPARMERVAAAPAPERRAEPVMVAQMPPQEPEPVSAPEPTQERAPALAPPVPEPVPPAPAEPENATPPAPPRIPNMVTLNAGLLIPVRLLDGLSTDRNVLGDAFTATLDGELVVDGFIIAERGARVYGRVVGCDRGKVSGAPALTIELTRLRTADGQDVAIQTDGFVKRAEPDRNNDAGMVVGGAAIGAIIGAIAGGGKGAVIGAGAGAGMGAGGVMLSRQPAALPSETRVTFRLRTAVPLTEKLSG